MSMIMGSDCRTGEAEGAITPPNAKLKQLLFRTPVQFPRGAYEMLFVL